VSERDPDPVTCVRPVVGRSRGGRGAAVVAGVALLVTGCTGSGTPSPPASTIVQTVTETQTPSAPPTFTPAPATTVRPLPPGAKAHAGETDGLCPYIRTGLDEQSDGGVNMADLEGDRIYRTTRLTRYTPVGCRFYFYAPPYEAVADIRPMTFSSPTAARNAMILTAEAGRNPITERNFVAGLDGICFQTRFFGPDGRRDWAFVFAKGRVMVGVYTQQSKTSRNAVYIARAIAAKF
jgi:hypothetical protein